MPRKIFLLGLLILLFCGLFLTPTRTGLATQDQTERAQTGSVTAFDLILAMNTLRVSSGLPALIEDPIVNAVAQSTAQIMAANEMSWHIGDVRGRIQAAGYGGGATVWATENFAVGLVMGIDQIMLAWADPDHMRPVTNPAYCHVGAGVARAANGRTYYVLQAAYTSGSSCGEYIPPGDDGESGGGSGTIPVPQIIIPVKVVEPDIDGKIYHVVQPGQSFWAIAIAYRITINDLEFWNNLSRENELLVGQRLFIPSSSTAGYATPTPVGMVIPNPPDADGKIVHTVESYHTLITISRAYDVPMDRIVALNGILVDSPLQIGQKLLISPGAATPTPLSPLHILTPASDGKYYHTVRIGETLSGIAGFYEISLADLMNWNSLNSASIIQPDQKLLLNVTLPATITPTSLPSTKEPSATPPLPTPTFSPSRTPVQINLASPPTEIAQPSSSGSEWIVGLMLSMIGLSLLFWILARNKSQPLN